MGQLNSLITASVQGDTEAFNQLYQYSFPTVEHECLRILRNPTDAEDAIQETYLIIYRKLGGLKDLDKFLSWCRTIAHNASVNYIAKRDRKAGKDETRPPVSDDHYIGMDAVDSEDTDITPEEKAEQELIRSYLQQAVDNIAPVQATCLSLHQQGYTYNQIAERLSIPVGTAKSNVHYAKTALQKEIHKIEQREHVQIHGFSLAPVAGKVLVQMASRTSSAQPAAETGFIQADESTYLSQEDIWSKVSHGISGRTASRLSLWKKITAVVVAVGIIVGGIFLAVNRAGHQNFADTKSATSLSQSLQGSQSRAAQRRLAPSNPNNVTGRRTPSANLAEPAVSAARNNSAAVRQAEPAPQTQAETTREIFTNEARNMGNVLAGN